MCEYVSAVYYSLLIYVFTFINITKLGYYTFIVNLEISFYEVSNFVLLFQHYFCCTRAFTFSYIFKNYLFD